MINNVNPHNDGYIEGRLLSMRMVDNSAGDKTIFLQLCVADNFKSKAGAYMYNGQMVKGYATHTIQLCGYAQKDGADLELFERLRNPNDSSATSCDQGAPIGFHYHLLPRDSGIPITNAQGQPVRRSDGSTVNHVFLTAYVDSIHFCETDEQRSARHASSSRKRAAAIPSVQRAM